MLNSIIDFSLRHRLLVCVAAVLLTIAGAASLTRLPVDAFPDTSNIQVQVNTVAAALNPLEIEQQITLPVELAINGLPGLQNVRSISKSGFSQVVAVFSDGTPVSQARQWVSERIAAVALPAGIERPQLGPISSGLGEVFHYFIRSDNTNRSLTELRELHDWVIKPELRKVSGVAEVNAWGGYEKQYHVLADSDRLVQFGLTFEDLFAALEANNQNVGGGQITRAGESLLVHGLGQVTSLEQLASITVATRDGRPIRVRDVANATLGHEIRRGAVTADGKGEVVMGLAFMLLGENSREVTTRLKERLADLTASLPPDVKLEVAYDRTQLVSKVIRTVEHNLLAGALLVIAVLFTFLGNLRAGLIVAAAIPLSMLFAGNLMMQVGIAASLLSLGAIDFGLIVDSSVIMVENCMRHIAADPTTPRRELVRRAILEVRRPALYGELAILIVFLPILALEGVEGKMFKPMALTMIFALLGALLFSVTLAPVLASLALPRTVRDTPPWIVRLSTRIYTPLLDLAIHWRKATIGLALLILAVGVFTALRLGAEFMPKLNEGAIVINVIRLAGVSVDESVSGNTRMEQRLLAAFPNEIERVWSRIGTAEVANDPMGVELTDIFMTLKPRSRWTKARYQHDLAEQVKTALADVPGVNMVYTQPIELRVNEMVAGIRADLGIKVYGDDFDELVRLGSLIQGMIASMRGAADLNVEQITGQPMVQIKIDQAALARHGLPARNVLNVIQVLGGRHVGEVREGLRTFPLVVRLPERQANDLQALGAMLLPMAGGPLLPLQSVAHIVETEGPATIQREWGRRRLTVQCNVQHRDVAGFVAEARQRIHNEVKLPPGYTLEWGGQFENLERANRRLLLVSGLTLVLVFFTLYATFQSVRDVLLVATGIPFGLVGGVLALAARGLPFTVSAGIGFIALSGVAILNGLVLVTFIRQRLRTGMPPEDAVREGCRIRLRPVLMTALVAAVGFIPMAVNMGVGAEVQRPLATVVIGGIFSNTVLTLLVLPTLYMVTLRSERSRPEPRSRTVEAVA